MNRDGIRAERVEHHQSVLAAPRFTQSQAGIADDDAHVGLRAGPQVGKVIRVPRNANHGRVNFVKGPFLVLLRVTDGRARPQADHANSRRARFCA